MADGPLIVQSDKTLLLEVDHEKADACRKAIAPFAELERAPEHVHTYRITPLALWNARAAGHDAEQVIDALIGFSRYPVPHALLVDIAETMARYGRLRLEKHPLHGLVLTSTDRAVLEEVLRSKKIQPLLGERVGDDGVGCTRASAATSSSSCSSWAGPPRTSPVTSTASTTRSPWPRTAGSSAPTSARPPRRSGTAARAWSCFPAGRARPSWARRRWRTPGPPR
nr:hypothetical protein GCM10020093_066630 [Planobispora longispora]